MDRNNRFSINANRHVTVALRKESVDRNRVKRELFDECGLSLSARRAWIEITMIFPWNPARLCRSPQGERG